MPEPRRAWLNVLAGLFGGLLFGMGIAGLALQINLWDSLLAVLGFLVVGWAVLDYRRYRAGTPESEVDGGHTIE